MRISLSFENENKFTFPSVMLRELRPSLLPSLSSGPHSSHRLLPHVFWSSCFYGLSLLRWVKTTDRQAERRERERYSAGEVERRKKESWRGV